MSNETILIVDDNKQIVDFLMNAVLKPMGFKMLSAADGEKGIKAALKNNPDLIMLDMSMPRMTGMEMLKVLRTTRCQAPVIFMTSYGSEQIAVEAFRLGVRDYLSKPFTIDDIQAAVNRALRETRLAREKEELSNNLVAAETVRQTVVTLAHYINNYLMVVESGLHLVQENVPESITSHPNMPEIISDSLSGVARIGAVIRVLNKVTEVRRTEYAGKVKMVDIESDLRAELLKSVEQ